MRVGINRNLAGKIDQSTEATRRAGAYKWTHGWAREDLTMAQFADEIRAGYGFGPWFKDGPNGGHRHGEKFHSMQVAAVDIDNKEGQRRWTFDELMQFEFVRVYGGMIYTTPSHTKENPRFRVVFELASPIVDRGRAKALNMALTAMFESDSSTTALAQCFHGSPQCEVELLNKVLPDDMITALLESQSKSVPVRASRGLQRVTSVSGHNNNDEFRLDPDTLVRCAGQEQPVPLNTLPNRQSVHCPDPTHIDRNPSASVVVSETDGLRGVWCYAHNKMHWVMNRKIRHVESYARDLLYDDLSEGTGTEGTRVHLIESYYDPMHADDKFVKSLPDREGILLIKSPKGTGKTDAISKLLKRKPARKYLAARDVARVIGEPEPEMWLEPIINDESSILLIGHRISLLRELARRLELTTYEEDGEAVPPTARYAVTLDSLHKRLSMDSPWRNYHTVVIDEVEQVVHHLLGETLKETRLPAIKALLRVVKNAKRLILSDADLGPMARLLLKSAGRSLDTEFATYIRNEPKGFVTKCAAQSAKLIEKGWPKVEVFSAELDLEEAMITQYKSGARIFVCSNSKVRAKRIAALLERLVVSENRDPVLLVTSNTKDDDDVKDFMSSPREKILNYSAVISSPTLGSGIDITLDAGAANSAIAVYGFFMPEVNTYTDIDQHLARVRNPESVSVWISAKICDESCDCEEIKNEIIFRDTAFHYLQEIDDEGYKRRDYEDPLLNFVAEITAHRRRGMRHMLLSYLQYKRNAGCVVVEVERSTAPHEELRRLRKEAKQDVEATEQHRLVTSERLDDEASNDLKIKVSRGQKITPHERASLDRSYIENFYKKELTDSLRELDDQGKYRKKVKRFELMLASEESVRRLDASETDILPMDRQVRMLVRTGMHALLDGLNLNCLLERRYPDDWEVSQATLERFRAVFLELSVQVLSFLDLNRRADFNESTVNTVRAVLRSFGLDLKLARRKSCKNGKREKLYQLDKDSFDRLVGVVKARAQRHFDRESDLDDLLKWMPGRQRTGSAFSGHTDDSRQGG